MSGTWGAKIPSFPLMLKGQSYTSRYNRMIAEMQCKLKQIYIHNCAIHCEVHVHVCTSHSDCTAWMDACQTSWMCGSEYKRQLYEAQQHHPPAAACPYPSPDPNYPPPTQPAPCTFNQQQGQCQFKACVNGMVYESCGSACPLTCKNINSTSSCIEVCSEGCFCPSGLVQLGDTCVQPSECEQIK